jgi:hypothetical protein
MWGKNLGTFYTKFDCFGFEKKIEGKLCDLSICLCCMCQLNAFELKHTSILELSQC